MRPLDDTDRQLLTLLKHNARASVTELAHRIGVSRITVKTRMEALQNSGVIQRFTVDVADTADADLIYAVSMLDIHLGKVDSAIRALRRMPEITSLHTTNGKWAVILRSETRNLQAFDALLSRVGRVDGIANVETCLLLSRLI